MAMNSAQDLIIHMMSDLMTSETRLEQFAEEASKAVQDQDAKDYFNARTQLRKDAVSNLEECFRLIGEQPVKVESRFRDVWSEDVRREMNAIQNPGLKAIYAIGTLRQIQDFHIGEYRVLRGVARVAGNYGVLALLDANLGMKLATNEETDELLRRIAVSAVQARRERAA